MNEVVFDASAVLALLQNEPGAEKLTGDVLVRAVASAVNLAEVQSKLVKVKNDPDRAWAAALSTVNAVEPYSREQARIASDLITQTEEYGLSLGDSSCLALAIYLGAEVYTTEQIWKNLKLGILIHVIR
ncbi:MAG TPA: type II toxin-antitoxin system VapC family toxin [Terracidiphilus sp.]|nr:type II toxin-antitoxin system VapC family toxin [Terracidiphilus sp.]